MRRPLANFTRLSPAIVLAVVVVALTSGCQYGRKWLAREELPAGARLGNDEDRREHLGSTNSASTNSEAAAPPASRSDEASPVSLVRNDVAGDTEERPPTVEDDDESSGRGRWDRLMEAFGRPRRIPLPRTDVETPTVPVAREPDFGGL